MFGINDNQNDDSQSAAKPDEPKEPQAEHGIPADSQAHTPSGFDSPAPSGPPSDTPSGDSLMSIKEQALTNLSPLVNHLDQTPDERFKTLMMLIQASDNSNFIKEAYEAANQIGDEKVRAQALLDVINEINYFTQHPDAKK